MGKEAQIEPRVKGVNSHMLCDSPLRSRKSQVASWAGVKHAAGLPRILVGGWRLLQFWTGMYEYQIVSPEINHNAVTGGDIQRNTRTVAGLLGLIECPNASSVCAWC
jgi:hypothetical protein